MAASLLTLALSAAALATEVPVTASTVVAPPPFASPVAVPPLFASPAAGSSSAAPRVVALAPAQESFDEAMQAGTRAMASGEPQVALDAFRRALSLRPGHPVARALVGAALLELGRSGEAVRELEQAARDAPSLFVAQYNLGLARLQAGDPAGAVAPLRTAHVQRPRDAGVRLNLGRALVDAGDPEAAVPHLRAVVDRHPEVVPAWQYLGRALLRLGRHAEALEALQQAGGLRPGDPVTLYGEALALSGLERWPEAAERLEQVVAADPDHADAWVLLGQVLARRTTDLQAGVRATEALERALELRPGDREASATLAELYRRLGLYEEALAVLDGVGDAADAGADTAGTPAGEAELSLLRGRLLSLLGRYSEARAALRRATDLGAGARAWYRLGIVHRNLAEVDAALEAFGRAVELEPGFAAAWRERGDLLIDRQRYAEARRALQAGVDAAPRDARAWYLLGLAHLREGNAEAAQAPLERALELDPEMASAAYNLASALRMTGRAEASAAMMERFQELSDEQEGTVSGVDRTRAEIATLNRQGLYYYRRGETEQALERFERALELGPENEVVHFNLGLAHAARADWESALAAFEEARSRNPDRPEVWAALAEVYRALGRDEDAARARARYEELQGR